MAIHTIKEKRSRIVGGLGGGWGGVGWLILNDEVDGYTYADQSEENSQNNWQYVRWFGNFQAIRYSQIEGRRDWGSEFVTDWAKNFCNVHLWRVDGQVSVYTFWDIIGSPFVLDLI